MTDLQARLEQALADNAVLRAAIESIGWRRLDTLADEQAHTAASNLLKTPHPGAAMLRELQALRRVRHELAELTQHIICIDHAGTPAWRSLLEACTEADKARGP